jgi:peptide/nickel transport system permease protein
MSDFSIAFPIIITAVLLTAILGPGTVNSILAIGIFNIPIFARITRGAANAAWAREYVMAAQTCGKGRLRITIEHVLPNISGALIVQATILFAVAILAEAALSFLGLGTQPPEPSWGKMLNNAQTFVGLAPHLAIFPGLAIALSVMGLNLIGDGLRDVLDPKLARAR